MIRRLVVLCTAAALVAGCSITSRTVRPGAEPIHKATWEIPESQLLDVWIETFDPGQLPDDEDDAIGLSMDIREAEARYMPVHLRRTMEKTGFWGAVRSVPQGTEGAEVLVSGKILESNGEEVKVTITAVDATGREWFRRTYDYRAPLDKHPLPNPGGRRRPYEVFAPLYDTIANDLADYREGLDPQELLAIRRLAELRFAADLAPDAFGGHVERDEKGRYHAVRLPAQNDPMYSRVQALRERDFLLIDTLNGHFDNFYDEMSEPYGEWRRTRAEEAEALRKIEWEATSNKLLGVAAIAGAIGLEVLGVGGGSTSTLRNVMVVGGIYAIKSGMDKSSETEIHREVIEELGDSFSSEARPLVVDVEGETVELSGSAEAQYKKWRGLLRRIYASETGFVDLDD